MPGTDGRSGYDYKPAQRGFLYYALNEKNKAASVSFRTGPK